MSEPKIPIFDRDLLEQSIRQSINFDQLTEVTKAEVNRVILKVIQPQITHWSEDLAQQVNRAVEDCLKKALGDPQKKESEFKEELTNRLLKRIIESEENVEKFITEMARNIHYNQRDIETFFMSRFETQINKLLTSWFDENIDDLKQKFGDKISALLEEKTSELIRRQLVATYDRIDEISKRHDQLQSEIYQVRNELNQIRR